MPFKITPTSLTASVKLINQSNITSRDKLEINDEKFSFSHDLLTTLGITEETHLDPLQNLATHKIEILSALSAYSSKYARSDVEKKEIATLEKAILKVTAADLNS